MDDSVGDRVLAVLTVQANNDQLSFANSGGIEAARLNIFGRVITLANRQLGKFEDSVTTTATSQELSTTRPRKSAYARAFILEPGRYRVDVIVRDIQSGAAGINKSDSSCLSFQPIDFPPRA